MVSCRFSLPPIQPRQKNPVTHGSSSLHSSLAARVSCGTGWREPEAHRSEPERRSGGVEHNYTYTYAYTYANLNIKFHVIYMNCRI